MPVEIMGVLNVTPDSFSDGGSFLDADRAIAHGLQMAADGADIIDVGGESTRPGAQPVGVHAELQRVIPVVESLSAKGITVSIDTSKPEVAERAMACGASIINDVTGLRNPEMRRIAVANQATACIMHMLGEPRTMQESPQYADVVEEVLRYFEAQTRLARESGFTQGHVWLDPGIGFGKTVEHNIFLLRGIDRFVATGYRVLVGVSRKSFIGRLASVDSPDRRMPGSLAAAMFAVSRGATILRVHDVAETRQALAVWQAVSG